MKTFSKIIAAFIFLCLSGTFLFAQTSERRILGRALISKSTPKIRLKFDEKFYFAGSHEFVLYERARAEQFFFVEAENKKIKRMFMVQFESFLSGVDAKYDYNEPNSVEIGGEKYFSNAEFISDYETAVKAAPESDVARAIEFLQDKGFVLPKPLIYQRFVRVLDDAKRSELIMLYVEAAENESAKKDLEKRALANFKVLK